LILYFVALIYPKENNLFYSKYITFKSNPNLNHFRHKFILENKQLINSKKEVFNMGFFEYLINPSKRVKKILKPRNPDDDITFLVQEKIEEIKNQKKLPIK
ncbi:hypothetical protein, partial [Chrysanthemum yellows phytoplasma]